MTSGERDTGPGDTSGPVERFPGIQRFLDRDGRLKTWPAKLRDRRLVMAWLASHFEPGADYAERQVNEQLNAHHAFGDWALLRRALVDHRWLEREGDGSRYRLRIPPPAM